MVDVTKENAEQLPVANKRKLLRSAFKKHNYIVVGAILVGLFVFIAILAPILAPMNPDQVNPAARLASIGTEGHILGTDHLGRDMLSRLIYGSQVTLLSGLAAALMAMLAGVSLGVFAAMSHKRIDNIIMRFIDVLMAFPAILLAILIVAFLGPGLKNALIAVALVNIPFYARLTRSVTLSLKEMEFIEASNAIGNRKSKTVFKHILPNISAYIVVQSMMNIGWMITETASLSFLGLGAQPPTADWGSMLGEGRSIMTIAPLTVALPGVCIFLVVMGFNLLGDGLRDYLDPKLKDR
ncbi:ABC transporter permease [Virgibacillus sp. W0181]|uniref:ABC transporter permease n=1 Tax=Virgibacillus sp. W0181 TaxID=3391581 RepID=UPI003F453D4D